METCQEERLGFLYLGQKSPLSFGIVVKRHSRLLARGNRKLLSRCLFPFQGQYGRNVSEEGFETARFFVRRSCSSIGAKRTTEKADGLPFFSGRGGGPRERGKGRPRRTRVDCDSCQNRWETRATLTALFSRPGLFSRFSPPPLVIDTVDNRKEKEKVGGGGGEGE